jgi:RimJ/RimL family protein N-acetyltransferase
MTECCQKVIGICFHEYGLNRLEIRCDPANGRSRAIPERLGFVQEGVLRKIAVTNGSGKSRKNLDSFTRFFYIAQKQTRRYN